MYPTGFRFHKRKMGEIKPFYRFHVGMGASFPSQLKPVAQGKALTCFID